MNYPLVIEDKPRTYSALLRKSPLVIIGTTLFKFSPFFILILAAYYLLSLKIGMQLISQENLKVAYRVVSALFVAECVRRYFNSIYIIGTQRLIQIEGFLSFRYLRSSITYIDIRDLELEQSLWGRILNHGTIRCGTSSTKDHELTFTDIFRGSFVKDIIEEKIFEASKKPLEIEEEFSDELEEEVLVLDQNHYNEEKADSGEIDPG